MDDMTLVGARPVRAPRGATLSCRGWEQEAALRMLMNNLDPEVAEDPDHRPVGDGIGHWADPGQRLRTEYGVALASRSASSSLSKRMIETTGPKISSRAIRWHEIAFKTTIWALRDSIDLRRPELRSGDGGWP